MHSTLWINFRIIWIKCVSSSLLYFLIISPIPPTGSLNKTSRNSLSPREPVSRLTHACFKSPGRLCGIAFITVFIPVSWSFFQYDVSCGLRHNFYANFEEQLLLLQSLHTFRPFSTERCKLAGITSTHVAKSLASAAVQSYAKIFYKGSYGNMRLSTLVKFMPLPRSTWNFTPLIISAIFPNLLGMVEIRPIGVARHIRDTYGFCNFLDKIFVFLMDTRRPGRSTDHHAWRLKSESMFQMKVFSCVCARL